MNKKYFAVIRLSGAIILLIALTLATIKFLIPAAELDYNQKQFDIGSFSLMKQDGTPLRSSSLEGSVYILALISPSCSYCYKQMPNLTSINRERDIYIIAVLPGNYFGYLSPDILKYYTQMFDEVTFDVNNHFNLSRLPQTYLYNKGGDVLYKRIGALTEDDANNIKSLIDSYK